MANEKGMSDEKKARLEAIRAANAAKKGQAADAAPTSTGAAAVYDAPEGTVAVPAVAPAQVAAAGASMPDDKKARLEAIRAAKRAQGGDAAPAPAAAAVTATPPAAPPAPAPAARPAAPTAAPARPAVRPAAKPAVLEEERIPASVQLRRAMIGAVIGIIICLLFATMTGNYITAAIWGAVLGALTGVLVLSWPPERTTGD